MKENIPKQLGFKALKEEELRQTSSHRFTKNLKFKVQKVNIHEHETKAPDYFNEGSLLKAMENPQNYINFSNKKYAQTLKQTGGIGTVATRADIIDKLFNMNALESRDGIIKVTSKGKQILELSPDQLTSPL